MVVDNKFDIGQIVFLRTDADQSPFLVTRLTINRDGILYYLTSGQIESCHYDFEISDKRDEIFAVDNNHIPITV